MLFELNLQGNELDQWTTQTIEAPNVDAAIIGAQRLAIIERWPTRLQLRHYRPLKFDDAGNVAHIARADFICSLAVHTPALPTKGS